MRASESPVCAIGVAEAFQANTPPSIITATVSKHANLVIFASLGAMLIFKAKPCVGGVSVNSSRHASAKGQSDRPSELSAPRDMTETSASGQKQLFAR
jgi:hypothetical protein